MKMISDIQFESEFLAREKGTKARAQQSTGADFYLVQQSPITLLTLIYVVGLEISGDSQL